MLDCWRAATLVFSFSTQFKVGLCNSGRHRCVAEALSLCRNTACSTNRPQLSPANLQTLHILTSHASANKKNTTFIIYHLLLFLNFRVLCDQNKDIFFPPGRFFCVWFLPLSQEMSVVGICSWVPETSHKSLHWGCIRHFPVQRWADGPWNMTWGFAVGPAGLHSISTCYTSLHSVFTQHEGCVYFSKLVMLHASQCCDTTTADSTASMTLLQCPPALLLLYVVPQSLLCEHYPAVTTTVTTVAPAVAAAAINSVYTVLLL